MTIARHFSARIAEEIWNAKYRWRDGDQPRDSSIEDTWHRVARALAEPEHNRPQALGQFYSALENFKFLPGGRILAGAGIKNRATLFNCFVMGRIEDSMDGIFDALKEGALTMQQGGGVGYDFSTLRPKGVRAQSTGRIASGPVPFMRIWNTMCATVLTTEARRGAMIATLRCDHPDILEFVKAKQNRLGDLNHFNLSVLVSDDFMKAVRTDSDWPLVFPEIHLGPNELKQPQIRRRWSGEIGEVPCRVLKVIKARELWHQIISSTYDSAEPGVLFIDRINAFNNLHYEEQISATNPCGEIPLPPYGACDLGSFNLPQFVKNPFTPQAAFDWSELSALVPTAVRMLDNVIEVSHFPLPVQEQAAERARRIGLGVTGLANAMVMLNLNYRQPSARDFAQKVMSTICHAAYAASSDLAREKAPFASYRRDEFLKSPFVLRLPAELRKRIENQGIRNSHLIAIAPTGTISLLANNVSSGIEPIFSKGYRRSILQVDGTYLEYEVVDYAVALWREIHGEQPLPENFVYAQQITPKEHLLMQAAIQPYVDNSISKTINVAENFAFGDFQDIYDQAYELGLKGCTTFRANPFTGSILRE